MADHVTPPTFTAEELRDECCPHCGLCEGNGCESCEWTGTDIRIRDMLRFAASLVEEKEKEQATRANAKPALSSGNFSGQTPPRKAGEAPLAGNTSIIHPIYYVGHPDGSYSVADPQPTENSELRAQLARVQALMERWRVESEFVLYPPIIDAIVECADELDAALKTS